MLEIYKQKRTGLDLEINNTPNEKQNIEEAIAEKEMLHYFYPSPNQITYTANTITNAHRQVSMR